MNMNMNMQYNPVQNTYQFNNGINMSASNPMQQQMHPQQYPYQNPLHNHNYFTPNLQKTHSLGVSGPQENQVDPNMNSNMAMTMNGVNQHSNNWAAEWQMN